MSASRTPQNGIAERMNRSIMNSTRTLMMEKNVSQKYWREVVSTAVYSMNQMQVKKGTIKTHFDIWHGYAPNVNYFKVFGSKYYILKYARKCKIGAKIDEGIFLSYSTKSKV